MKSTKKTNQAQLERTRELSLRAISAGQLEAVIGGRAASVYARPLPNM